MRSAFLLSAAALGIAVGLSGCATETSQRGYVTDSKLVKQVRPGVDNENSVSDTLGRPTTVSNFDDSVWYYISMTEERRSFFRPEILEQQVFAVHFGDNGLVSEVETYTLADAMSVNPVNAETPTRGKELNLMQQLFGNIGRFSGRPGRRSPGQGGPGGPGGPYQN